MDKDPIPNQEPPRTPDPEPIQDRGRKTQGRSTGPERTPALLEALLFVSSRPLSAELIAQVTGLERDGVIGALRGLMEAYADQGRGFTLEEVAGGYQMRTREEFAQAIARLHQSRARRRFTRYSLETLAIVAYRQPVSRAEIEHIRGVDCGAVIKGLLSQSMVRVLGRKETPGRPILYGTTREFLEYFGLRDIESLPTLQEVTDLLEEGEQARAALVGKDQGGEADLATGFPPADPLGQPEEGDEPGDLEGEG